MTRLSVGVTALLASLSLVGCGSDDDSTTTTTPDEPASAFQLKFAALVDGKTVGCADELAGFGPAGAHKVGINDLRFYVSNLVFKDAAGTKLLH